MEKIILKAKKREETGKKPNKELRRKDEIPGVVYRRGKETMALRVPAKGLEHAIHTKAGENAIITLVLEDGKSPTEKTIIIKELQHHPLKNMIMHVDFQEISLTEKLQVDVVVEAKGQPEGVVKDGGMLEYILREVKVECLPVDIPDKIAVDVSAMKINDKICVKDLALPPGVKILNDAELIVLAIEPPYVEEVAEAAAPEGEVTAEPEVIGEKERLAKEATKAAAKTEKAAEEKTEQAKETAKEKK